MTAIIDRIDKNVNSKMNLPISHSVLNVGTGLYTHIFLNSGAGWQANSSNNISGDMGCDGKKPPHPILLFVEEVLLLHREAEPLGNFLWLQASLLCLLHQILNLLLFGLSGLARRLWRKHS